MKMYSWLRGSTIKFKSTFRQKSFLFGFLALTSLGFSGCAITECSDGEGPEPAGICNTIVTVEENSCWQGSEGNFWFRTNQGKLLMPTNSLVNVPELANGMRLKIGYKVVEENPQFETNCLIHEGIASPHQSIAIACAEPIDFCGTPTQSCNISATAEQVVCGAGVWYNIWLRLDDGTLLQPWENNSGVTSLTPGQRYKIGYELMQRDNRYQNAVICQAVPPVADAARITCLEADFNAGPSGK